jgi:ferritin-like metal-binding protein YciE
MGLIHETFNSLDDLLEHQIGDIYDAEHRISDALPKMQDAATHPQLKAAFESHLAETKAQIERLDQVFSMLGKDAKRVTCEATKGLIKEGEDAIKANGDDDVRDAALIGAAQRVEHYEIASYGTARNLARRVGRDDVAQLLQTSLDEEYGADRKLSDIAEGTVNAAAAV